MTDNEPMNGLGDYWHACGFDLLDQNPGPCILVLESLLCCHLFVDEPLCVRFICKDKQNTVNICQQTFNIYGLLLFGERPYLT